MRFRVRDTEACEPSANFIWDSVWHNRLDASGGFADWIMAGPEDPPEQRGGLRARSQLMTAVMIQLFTDARLPEEMTPPDDSQDRRGWWGNSIRLPGEPENAELGSLLWTLERGTLDEDTARLAKDYAEDALKVIVDQGAVSRFEVETWADVVGGFLGIEVRAYDHANRTALNQQFEILWQQLLPQPAQMTFNAR